MAKFCTSCGGALLPNAKFCDACGAPAPVGDGVEPGPIGAPRPSPSAYAHPAPESLASRFFGFDRLIGRGLIKFIYYVGLVLIGLFLIISLGAVGQFSQMMGGASGLMFIFVIIGAGFSVIVWRFWCECAILLFLLYDRLGEVRDRLPAGGK